MQTSTWSTSLHLSFRLLNTPSPNLRPFLESAGQHRDDVLAKLPYDERRSKSPGAGPDPRRYRDGRQLYEAVGLMFETPSREIAVTELGKATLRWLSKIHDKNVNILGRYAAYALSACQLRNPTGPGQNYDSSFQVFPFAFIWLAMFALDGFLTSEELSRGMFRVKNENDLEQVINVIRSSRKTGDLQAIGEETVEGKGKEDRIIPWMSMASFGWILFSDKHAGDGAYRLIPRTRQLLAEAASLKRRHLEYSTVADYAQRIASAAALPKDVR
jgi:hypothetical protein